MSLWLVTIDTSELSTDSWVVVQTREGRPYFFPTILLDKLKLKIYFDSNNYSSMDQHVSTG